MSEGKAGRPRKYNVAQVRAAVEQITGSRAEAPGKWVVAARDIAALLEQEHGIKPTMRLDTLQAQIDEIAEELKKHETEAQRTTLAPEQAEALRSASSAIEDILIGVFAGQNARTDALVAAIRARAAADDDERRQRVLELSVQLDEAKEANERLAVSEKTLQKELSERASENVELRLRLSRLEGMIAAFEMQVSSRASTNVESDGERRQGV